MINTDSWLNKTKDGLSRSSGNPADMVVTPYGVVEEAPYSIGEFVGDAAIPVVAGGSLSAMVGEFGRGLAATLGNIAYAGSIIFVSYLLFSFRRRWADLLAASMLATEAPAIRGVFRGVTGLIGGNKDGTKSNYIEDMGEMRAFLTNGLDDVKRAALSDMLYNSMVQHGDVQPQTQEEMEMQRQRFRGVVSRAAQNWR